MHRLLDRSPFSLSLGDQKLAAQAPNTGDYGKFQQVELGTLELARSGKASLIVKAVPEGWQPFNLKSINLTAAP